MPGPLKSSFFKHFIFHTFSGRAESFKHPGRRSFSRELKLSILLGRHSRFWQSPRFNEVSAVKHPIEEGSSSTAVLFKESSDRLFIIPLNSGIFVIFMQSQRLRIVRDSISVDMLGRFVRDRQDSRSKTTSLLSCPIDGCISTKLWQPIRYSLSSLGSPEKSGVPIRNLESLRSMDFNLSKYCCKKKEKKRTVNLH